MKSLKQWFVKKVLIRAVIGLVILMVVIKGCNYGADSWACRSQWLNSGMDYRYGLRSGCMIKPDEYWIPANNYRG